MHIPYHEPVWPIGHRHEHEVGQGLLGLGPRRRDLVQKRSIRMVDALTKELGANRARRSCHVDPAARDVDENRDPVSRVESLEALEGGDAGSSAGRGR